MQIDVIKITVKSKTKYQNKSKINSIQNQVASSILTTIRLKKQTNYTAMDSIGPKGLQNDNVEQLLLDPSPYKGQDDANNFFICTQSKAPLFTTSSQTNLYPSFS